MEYVEEKRKKQKLLKERKNQKNVMKKSERAITLIALVITIIVLLILAGVSIAMLTGENGILNKADTARKNTEVAGEREQITMAYNVAAMEKLTEEGEVDVTKIIETELKKQNPNVQVEETTGENGESKTKVTFTDTKNTYEVDNETGEITGNNVTTPGGTSDPSDSSEETTESVANAPELKEGMTAKIIDEETGEPRDVIGDEEWYDYCENDGTKNNSKWANAQTEDGSMWVWIPRFAYKITSKPSSSDETGTIDVKFISTDTKGTKADGENVYKTEDGYIIHPAFTDDKENGGWRKNISGFWVAKYEMSMEEKQEGVEENDGWQHKETTIGDVALSNTIRMVSKPGVTSWRNINTANCYTNAYNYNRNLESHLMKNSEWGAVAYLTHSQYGRAGQEVEINGDKNFYTAGESGGTPKDHPEQSSTGNVTGVYDLSGGAMENVAAFNTEYTGRYYTGEGYVDAEGNHFATEGDEKTTRTTSTEYATAYTSTSMTPTEYTAKPGDATYEVYVSDNESWFNDSVYFVDTERSNLRTWRDLRLWWGSRYILCEQQ